MSDSIKLADAVLDALAECEGAEEELRESRRRLSSWGYMPGELRYDEARIALVAALRAVAAPPVDDE